MSFDNRFEAAFDNGLADIKFFVRPANSVKADDLRRDILKFQDAIEGGKTKKVESVD